MFDNRLCLAVHRSIVYCSTSSDTNDGGTATTLCWKSCQMISLWSELLCLPCSAQTFQICLIGCCCQWWRCLWFFVSKKWQLLQTLILNVFNLACIHHTGKCQIKQARTAITGEMGKLPNWLQWIWNRFFNSHFRTTIAAAGVKGFVLFWKTFSCVLRPSIGTATAK